MKILSTKMKIVSSLEKVFFAFPEEVSARTGASMVRNERHSFQLAVELQTDWDSVIQCRLELDSDIAQFISLYSIGYVPSMHPTNPALRDGDYLTYAPGLFPDPMYPIHDGRFSIMGDRAVSIWFSVEPEGKASGIHPITIRLYDPEDHLLGETVYTLEILDCDLPPQRLLNTGWFHGDCLAALHHAEIGTPEYEEVLEKYLAVYGKFGHNTILTPIFTPPLDTDEGLERPTNQLVDVTVTNGAYTFGFQRLGQWIGLCRKYGITHFEMAHLFTQWGAFHAPKIMATVDGEYKRIFGWDTDALSQGYRAFLDAFLPELRRFLEDLGVYEICLFHVSDEPTMEHLEQYRACRAIVAAHISEDQMMDAISDYAFFEKGLIRRPVACNDHIAPFLEHRAEHLWTYYCCVQGVDVANRFFAMPSHRSRILGLQLYKYRMEGFLQWGFNFWFTARSRGVIDPYQVTDAGDAFPSGDAFVVYPMKDGEVITSLRLYVFNEAMQDLRALELLESLTDRETVEALLPDIQGFGGYPRSADYILNLRETVNRLIQENLEATI